MSDNKQHKPTVFISYSHQDEVWKERLRPHLGVLEKAGQINIWDDRNIDAGAEWYDKIKQVIDEAAVAVCLISAHYLDSDFCFKEEVPYLLERRERDGMILIPVLVSPCVWKAVPWLKKLQMLPRDGQSLSKDFKESYDEVFAAVAESIFEKIADPNYQLPAPPAPPWEPPEKIDITRLPETGKELFGRQSELALLDDAWESDRRNIVSLVAWGGVGKSTLVNKWLEQLKSDNYRGARRVYAWSFYSQGTGERVTSADQFINNALTWFGDEDPTAGSAWDKGERLARLVQREKTLLLLDGLEPLQSPYDSERGKIKDPALARLLIALARKNPGLCIITTREPVTDLAEFSESVLSKDLEQISDEAGRALLRIGGVKGTDAELEQAVRDFGNHALAINLLAVYLHDIPGHHVSHAAEIPDLDIPEARGKHPRRMMAAFEQRFGDGPEVELLRMLGLFNRPADKASLKALRRNPPIHGLTDNIRKLTEARWLQLIDKLRRTKLIAPQSQHRPEDLDAHPLVREHFGQQLKSNFPDAWQAGNSRLFEHLKRTAKVSPKTLEDMMPLYAAVAHGCEAGRYEDAFDLFCRRIIRGEEQFSTRVLGSISADLVALSGFFIRPWLEPVDELSDNDKSLALHLSGTTFQFLGRLREAAESIKASLEGCAAREEWGNVVIGTGNLSKIYLNMGDLSQALNYIQQVIGLADKNGRAFDRMMVRVALAETLHQIGHMVEAETVFCTAEEILKEMKSRYSYLFSLAGFRYNDFLLDQGKYEEVRTRVLHNARLNDTPLDLAVDHLSLGRASLLQTLEEANSDFTEATDYINHAVDSLRHVGGLELLARGLIVRAELHRAKGLFEQALEDLNEAMEMVASSGMGLHEADCHLEYARLYLAQGEREKARESWERARGMIERMGYHRRDRDVEEIGRQLGGGE